ncbi:MAG: cupin domain-containing protein [Clostridiales bacterium]|nr:cupin domain-containing protein [Clostridiales bacterium]
MKKMAIADVKPYAAPGHFDVSVLRLQGTDETGIKTFWVGKSLFLPGGGADWGYEDNPNEKVYFVLKGEITVESKDEVFRLKEGDSIYIAPFEGRKIKNETNDVCEMLVMITYKGLE